MQVRAGRHKVQEGGAYHVIFAAPLLLLCSLDIVLYIIYIVY